MIETSRNNNTITNVFKSTLAALAMLPAAAFADLPKKDTPIEQPGIQQSEKRIRNYEEIGRLEQVASSALKALTAIDELYSEKIMLLKQSGKDTTATRAEWKTKREIMRKRVVDAYDDYTISFRDTVIYLNKQGRVSEIRFKEYLQAIENMETITKQALDALDSVFNSK